MVKHHGPKISRAGDGDGSATLLTPTYIAVETSRKESALSLKGSMMCYVITWLLKKTAA